VPSAASSTPAVTRRAGRAAPHVPQNRPKAAKELWAATVGRTCVTVHKTGTLAT
jgi:hypothetical protein